MEYLLQVKLGCLFGLLLLTLFFGLVPSRIRCFRAASGTEIHQMWLSFISCIAGGVFLGACLLDIVPDFLGDMKEAMAKEQIITDYPLPEFILGTGVLLVLTIERIVLECSHSMTEETAPLLSSPAISPAVQENLRRHSHGGQDHTVEHGGRHFHVDFNAHSSFPLLYPHLVLVSAFYI
ncbi:unnamed protein product [Staurois parvus]|uniref:Zinc transporter ZIP1 n=1 Tax=Staurois parvus TaxID=386267 RepID=A0ABN9D385_9NEOB|nr:unnamed protein product [Staurois parvus]